MTTRIYENQLKRQLFRANTTVCKNIRLLRLIHGFCQQEMADLLCMSRSTYFAIESGSRLPDMGSIITLSEHYNIDVCYMISFDMAKQLMTLLHVGREEISATHFIEHYIALSESNKAQVAVDIKRIEAHEKNFNNLPWKYTGYETLFTGSGICERR